MKNKIVLYAAMQVAGIALSGRNRRRILAVILMICTIVLTVQAKTVPQPKNPNAACAEAWHNYRKANALWITGWGLFGVGLGVDAVAGMIRPIAAFGNSTDPMKEGNPAARAAVRTDLALLGVGSGMVVASIPCLIVGQIRRKEALKTYRETCKSDQPAVLVSFRLSAAQSLLSKSVLSNEEINLYPRVTLSARIMR